VTVSSKEKRRHSGRPAGSRADAGSEGVQAVRKKSRSMKSVFILILLLPFAFFACPDAEAGQGAASGFEAEFVSEEDPIYFSGDRFSYNLKSEFVKGIGNVEVIQGESMLQGRRIIINLSTGVAEIEGDVVATRQGDRMEGEKGVYDFGKGEGIFYSARGHSEPWYVSVDEARREASGRYSVENGSLTTCSLAEPHYRLRADSVTVVPEERVVARNMVLFAGPVPIFYLPYYSQGLGPDRPPVEFSAGTQTDLGAYARVGYNLELGKEVQLNPHVWGFTKSGVGGGLDGRLNLFDGSGRGKFDSFYISDMNDDNTDEIGVEQDRGKADIYYRQELPYDVTTLFQLEYITDSEFLKTFDFDDYTGRELPETFVNVERTGEHSVISFTVRERLVDYIEDVDRLPELRVDLLEQRIGDTGLFFAATNDLAYLDNESGGPQATRNFSRAQLGHPVRLWRWLGLAPFIGGDATYYSQTPAEEDEYRVSWNTGIVAQTRFQKVYGSPFGRYSAFRHLVVPTATYRFRPDPDERPEELPQFDRVDLIDRQNMLEVEIKNYLQAKRRDGESIDFAEYNITAGLEFDDGEDTFATLENEFLVRPVPNWEMALKALNDFRDESRADLVSAVVRYRKPGSIRASAGVIHEDTALKPFETQAIYSFSRAFGPKWRAGFEQRYNFASDEFTYQEFWVWRDLHCWEALLTVRDRQEATTVMMLFNIKAFPMRKIENKIALNQLGRNNPWPTRW